MYAGAFPGIFQGLPLLLDHGACAIIIIYCKDKAHVRRGYFCCREMLYLHVVVLISMQSRVDLHTVVLCSCSHDQKMKPISLYWNLFSTTVLYHNAGTPPPPTRSINNAIVGLGCSKHEVNQVLATNRYP